MLLKNRPFPPDRESGAKLFILKPYRTTGRKRRKISEHPPPPGTGGASSDDRARTVLSRPTLFPARPGIRDTASFSIYSKPYRTTGRKRRKISEHPRPETAEPHQTTTRTLFFPGRRYFPPDRESETQHPCLFIQSHIEPPAGNGAKSVSTPPRPELAEPHQTTVRALFFPDRRYFPPDRESEIQHPCLFIQSHTEPPAGNGAKSVSTPARKQRSLIRQQRAHCSFPADVISRPTGNQRYNILVYLFKAIPNHRQETAQNQ